jgi:hypothetical protein
MGLWSRQYLHCEPVMALLSLRNIASTMDGTLKLSYHKQDKNWVLDLADKFSVIAID